MEKGIIRHIGHIGHGKMLAREMKAYHNNPVVIINPPSVTEEQRKKILEALCNSSGRAMLMIEPPEIEMIPYVSPKRARFLKYAGRDKSKYQVRTKKGIRK